MLSKENAKKLAETFIESIPFESLSEDKLVIIDEYTLEKDYGWIFSYNTQTFSITKDYGDSLINHGPVIVNKETGVVEEIVGGPFLKQKLVEYELKILKSNNTGL
jgi:Immunity protein 35